MDRQEIQSRRLPQDPGSRDLRLLARWLDDRERLAGPATRPAARQALLDPDTRRNASRQRFLSP